MRVGAVIVAYDSQPVLQSALASLMTSDPPVTQVVVVDNSPHGTDEACARRFAEEFPHMHITTHRLPYNPGYAAAVNAGLKRLSADFYLVMNPDVIVQPGCLKALLAEMRNDSSVGVAAPAYYSSSGLRSTFETTLLTPSLYLATLFRSSTAYRGSTRKTATSVEWAPGAFLLVRSEAVAQVGGMDERFFLFMEDADWCRRFLLTGWSIRVVPDAAITHDWGHAATRDISARVLRTHLAKLYYCQKHLGPARLRRLAAIMIVESILKYLASLPMRHKGRAGYLRLLPLALGTALRRSVAAPVTYEPHL